MRQDHCWITDKLPKAEDQKALEFQGFFIGMTSIFETRCQSMRLIFAPSADSFASIRS